MTVPVLAFVAFSGTGKTTLLSQVIPLLKAKGIRCAVIKHSHHDFEIDQEGKDSHRLRKSGADQVILSSPHRTFWVQEGDGQTERKLDELIARLDQSTLDLILAEGFRTEPIPKIEVHRPSLGTPLLCAEDDNVLALACDASPDAVAEIPQLPLNEPGAVAEFVSDWLSSKAR